MLNSQYQITKAIVQSNNLSLYFYENRQMICYNNKIFSNIKTFINSLLYLFLLKQKIKYLYKKKYLRCQVLSFIFHKIDSLNLKKLNLSKKKENFLTKNLKSLNLTNIRYFARMRYHLKESSRSSALKVFFSNSSYFINLKYLVMKNNIKKIDINIIAKGNLINLEGFDFDMNEKSNSSIKNINSINFPNLKS